MTSDTSAIPQWTELGSQLAGPDAERKREEIVNILLDLNFKVEQSMHSASAEVATQLKALQNAIKVAREITDSVLKPVDLSSL